MSWIAAVRGVHRPVDKLGIDSGEQAKADNGAVFVGSCFSLLSRGEDYRITQNCEIIDWDRLTDSLSS
jgi:hypothetical protein